MIQKAVIKKVCFVLIHFGTFAIPIFGQDTASIYTNLERKKFYGVSTSSYSFGDSTTYTVNNKIVSKDTYEKYKSTWENMSGCCPCILEVYNEHDTLLRESVSCGDCGVGWLRKYYPNGQIQLTGYYKENPTGNWENIYDRGYCNVKEGEWIYFSENGDTLYSEFWENGQFIKQVPEQAPCEIWKVDLLLNGKDMNQKKISAKKIPKLVIVPHYKNSNTNSSITISFEVSAVGYKPNMKEFTVESFKNIDVYAMMKEVGIPKSAKVFYSVGILSDGKLVARFYLN